MESPNPALSMPFDLSFLSAMDNESAALILRLQLEDIASIFASAKGKGRATDGVGDDEYALKLQQQELETSAAILSDRRMGQSISRAVQDDRHVLACEAAAEEAVARDHKLACEMGGWPAPATASCGPSGSADGEDMTVACSSASMAADDEYLAKLMALYVSEEAGARLLADAAESVCCGVSEKKEVPTAESSLTGAKKGGTAGTGKAATAQLDRRCAVCKEEKKFFDVATLQDCRHDYCRDCLDQLFRLSITDESFFPPRCCRQPIALRDVRVFLTAATAREFERKRPELETPDRTYCHRRVCGAWIPPRHVYNDVGTCPECLTPTCTICKGETHVGDCPDDEATQQLLQTADENGWQRCYQCRRVTELEVGCNHMTCRCGAQFCYVCGERWKNCGCPQWYEHRLYRRAAQIQQRQPLAMPARPEAPFVEVNDDGPPADDPPADDLLADNPQEGPVAPEQDEEDAAGYGPEAVLEQPPPAAAAPARSREAREMQRMTDDLDIQGLMQDRNIQAIANHLRENHECAHAGWNLLRGRHQCEECSFMLPKYIFECRQCMLRACNRCRRNRL